MSDENKIMQCPRHGEGHVTYVCQHLVNGNKLGFYHGQDGDDPRPDAWCAECDKELMAQKGEWNDISEKALGVTVMCQNCYDEIRVRNTTGNENL